MKSLVTAKSTVNKHHRCDSHKMSRDKIGLPVPSDPNQNPQCVYNPIGLTVHSVCGVQCRAARTRISYMVLFLNISSFLSATPQKQNFSLGPDHRSGFSFASSSCVPAVGASHV